MSKTPKSVQREIGANAIRSYSSFDDFVSGYIADGEVKSAQDLVSRRPDLLTSILFEWYRQGQIACIFARLLVSKKVDPTKWKSIVIIEGSLDVNELETILIDASDRLEALQIIFPGAGTALQAVELVKTLCAHDSWACREMPWLTDDEGKTVELGRTLQVGLRWNKPQSDYTSWALGIAPFDTMPFTRRFVGAPFIALVLRPSPPTAFIDPKFEDGLQASHLAHMNDTLGEDHATRKSFTEATKKLKYALLGGELLSTARAKVTFSLPQWCRAELGDILKPLE